MNRPAALVGDLLNPDVYWVLAATLHRTGRFADAEATYRKLIELAPEYSWAHEYLARMLLAEGKSEAALNTVRRELEEADRVLTSCRWSCVRSTAAPLADAALQVLTTKYADTDAYAVAMNYAYRGDRDLALQWLERAYQQKDSGFIEIVGEPLFKSLVGDSRFKAILSKINLPE